MRASDRLVPAALAARIAEQGVGALRPHLLAEAPEMPTTITRNAYDAEPEIPVSRPGKLTPAAVLLPIVARPEPTVLFTRRTPNLVRHAGQVSFPGGRVHESDPSLTATALRETQEETGIGADYVSVAGFLEPYETGTGFAIVPVVGVLREGFVPVPDPGEVDEVFEVPLEFLLDPANRERKSIVWQGRTRRFYAFSYDRHHIWGATAAILVNFGERLAGP